MQDKKRCSESEKRSTTAELHLQWHQHQNTLVSVFDSLWEQQEFVDITLAAHGQFIQVHRVILCACSQYFQELLAQSHFKKPSLIFLKDVQFSDLEALVHYMYKGEVRISEDRLDSFLQTAKALGIRGIMDTQKETSQNLTDNSTNQKPSEEDTFLPQKKRKKSIKTRVQSILKTQTHSRFVSNNDEAAACCKTETCVLSEEDEDGVETFWSENLPEVSSLEMANENSIAKNTNDQTLSGSHDLPLANLNLLTASEAGNMENHWTEGSLEIQPGYGDSDQFYCPRCGRGYKYKHTVRRHLRYECGVEPQFKCRICEARFHHNGVLIRHMKKHGRSN